MTFRHFTVLADRIDRLNTAVGRAASWCALAIVLLGFAVVLLRYLLGVGSIWLQESILYAHAALFLLAAAWTLKEGGHVRVDVFYASAAPRTKAWIDLLGALFLLLPFAVAIVWFSLPYVARSWAILERSRETQRPAAGVSPEDADPAIRAAARLAGPRSDHSCGVAAFPLPASRGGEGGRD